MDSPCFDIPKQFKKVLIKEIGVIPLLCSPVLVLLAEHKSILDVFERSASREVLRRQSSYLLYFLGRPRDFDSPLSYRWCLIQVQFCLQDYP